MIKTTTVDADLVATYNDPIAVSPSDWAAGKRPTVYGVAVALAIGEAVEINGCRVERTADGRRGSFAVTHPTRGSYGARDAISIEQIVGALPVVKAKVGRCPQSGEGTGWEYSGGERERVCPGCGRNVLMRVRGRVLAELAYPTHNYPRASR